MAYQISPHGKGFLSKIHKNGKEKELVPTSYNPPLQTPIDILSIILGIAAVGLIVTGFLMYGFISACLAIILFSIRELFIQDDHSIVRIYGPFGRLRYLVEDALRDKIMQYFTETNTEGRPIPKIVRNYIYARAHGAKSLTSFGTEVDITDTENTASARILHRNFPGVIAKASYELTIGEHRPDIKLFKVISCVNVSAMSFGALNYKACESISFGTKDSVMTAMEDGPDAIQVDGADGGTGAGPSEFVNYVGYGSVIETVAYLHKKLQSAGIRDKVVISASGKLFTPSHAAVAFAYGADIIDTARGAMLALGCIQALRCHTGECPTGITTHNSWRMHGIDIPEKSTRVHYYLKGFHDDMLQLTHVLGRTDPRDIKPQDVRIMSKHKNDFQKYFEEDPFGLYIATPEKMIADSLL